MSDNMDNKSVTLKDLREKFYALRDLEIQNLWQRASIFAGLIGLFFAGYGYILLNILIQNKGYLHIFYAVASRV